MAWEHASPLIKFFTIIGIIAGIILALLGIWLVYLGSTGDTEFNLFGQTFKSSNVGIAAIFIGAVVIITSIRSGKKMFLETLNTRPEPNLPPPDSINFSIPKGCTFKQAVESLVQNDMAVADYGNLSDKELKAPLQARALHEKTVSDAISRLRYVTIKPNAIPEYEVNYNNSVYSLKKKQ